jgi:DNA-binding transcriptional ArsR family regulator
MNGEPDIAVPARALGDPARGRIVIALLGGRSIPAGDLARAAGVSASTASEHLRVLLAAGIVAADHRGRNRFFRLASSDVSLAIEALQAIAPPSEMRSLRQHHVSLELRSGRSCYDHLAGDLGLRVTDLLLRSATLTELQIGENSTPPEPFPDGPVAVAFDIRPPQGRRPWARGCLDWTGRRAHAAGQLGAQVLRAMDAQGWVARRPDSRAVRLTELGAARLAELETAVGSHRL